MMLRISRFFNQFIGPEIVAFLLLPTFFLSTFLYYKQGNYELMWSFVVISILMTIGCTTILLVRIYIARKENRQRRHKEIEKSIRY